MAGQGDVRPMTVNEGARKAVLVRRDEELAAKAGQRDELEKRVAFEMERLEELAMDRDTMTAAFEVSIGACGLRLDALRRALSAHHDDEPDDTPVGESIPYDNQLAHGRARAAGLPRDQRDRMSGQGV